MSVGLRVFNSAGAVMLDGYDRLPAKFATVSAFGQENAYVTIPIPGYSPGPGFIIFTYGIPRDYPNPTPFIRAHTHSEGSITAFFGYAGTIYILVFTI